MDDDKLFLNEYSGLSNLLGGVKTASLSDYACPADGSDCSSDCSDCSSDCSSDCKSDCSSDCRSDCRSDCSDTPSYLVYVETFLDGYSYDLAGRSYTVQSRTVSSWKSAVGVDTPPNSNFVSGEYYRGGTHGSCTLSTSLTNSAILEIYLYYETKTPVHTPITITSGSMSKTTITSGDDISFSWSYSGDKETTGSWNLVRTASSTYSNPTTIANLDQSRSTSYSQPWGPTGTYHIWVFYYGETGGTSYTSNVYYIGQLTVNPSPVTYTVTVYSYTNSTEYDHGSISNVVSGTSKTFSEWVSSAGVSLPPAPATFQRFTINGGSDIITPSTPISISANTTIRVYYYLKTSHVTVYIFHNGWKEATPYIFHNRNWYEAEPDLFDGGWQND